MNDNSANGIHDNRNGKGQLVPAAQTSPATLDPYGPPLAGYGQGVGVADESEQFARKLVQIWRILNKRKWLILGITAACLALNTVRILMQTPLYTATVRIQIDPEKNIVPRANAPADEGDNGYGLMPTQEQILRSRHMAERVASALKLGDDTNFFKPRGVSVIRVVKELLSKAPDEQGAADRQSAAAGIVAQNVVTRPVQQTRLLDISYSDPDPARAQRIANAYADAFVATTIDKRFQANASAKIFLEDKIEQLKLRLEDSEKKLLAFAQDQQIVGSDGDTEKASIAGTNLASANAELGTLISERTKNEQLWKQLESADAINLPQVLTNPVIATLRDKHKALVLDYQEKLETFKPGYPLMIAIDSKIKEIDQQLASEVQAIKDSLKAAYQSSLARENLLKQRIETLERAVLDLQKRSIQYNILKREVDTNRELYASLLQRYKEVDVASGVGANNIFVVDQANSAPPSSNLPLGLVLALMLGLVAGCATAYGLEILDDKVRSIEQVEAISGLPVLGVIPKSKRFPDELSDLRSPVAEAYRALCTSLQFASETGLPKTLVITSAIPSEGKSSTAISIAKHFAMLGRNVLLIDADLRNPSLHARLDRDNSIGLSNYLMGTCTPPEAMQKTEIRHWAFIASGPLPPNAADLLGGNRLHSLLSIGSEVFDFIIIDAPPVLGLADASILASAAAATILVVGSGEVRPAFIRDAMRHLQLSRASLIGAVLTKFDAKAVGHGYGSGYGYGYSYGYGYGSSADPCGLSVVSSAKSPPQLTDAHGNA